jgi:hypothetical protein
VTRRLQTAELTVNLNAPAWFLKPNPYNTHTQMYERATGTMTGAAGRTVLATMLLRSATATRRMSP